MEALYDINAVDKQTMRDFDKLCLSPALPMPPERIKALRQRENL